MCVGQSITHGEAAPLVLCLKTRSIMAQYYVVCDDWFQTVEAITNPKVNFKHDDWYKTFGLTKWQCVPSDKGLTPPTETMPDLKQGILYQQEMVQGVQDQQHPARPLTNADLSNTKPSQQREFSLQRETKLEAKPLPTVPVKTVDKEPVMLPSLEAPTHQGFRGRQNPQNHVLEATLLLVCFLCKKHQQTPSVVVNLEVTKNYDLLVSQIEWLAMMWQ